MDVPDVVPDILSASSLKGDKVVNEKGEDLGSIVDVVLDITNDSIAYVVISFGGFMGVANKLFGVPIEALNKKPDEDVFVLDVDKERLKAAPGFDKDKWPGMGEAQMEYAACVYGYYGYACSYEGTEILGESKRTWDTSLEEPSGKTLEELGGIKEKGGKTIEDLGGIKEEGRTLKGAKKRSEK